MKINIFINYLLIVLFVTFFSFTINSYAATNRYDNFNWDKLLKENKNYWVEMCDEDDEECVDAVIKTKEKFYRKLYKLLKKYDKSGYFIDDAIVIETVFYGLNPDSFSDPDINDYNPFNIDDEADDDKYIASDDGDYDSAKEYFEQEKDTIKTLLNNFIGYKSTCYGISDIVPTEDEFGYKSCPVGFDVVKTLFGEKCAKNLDTYRGTFFDSLGLIFFGNSNKKKCAAKAQEEGYSSYKLSISKTKEVSEEFFYEFLKTSTYFDKKKHLQFYFSYILNSTGYKNMTEFYEASENDPSLIEKYEDDIIEAREIIIEGIKEIVALFREQNPLSDDSKSVCNSNSTYWWPIGGSDISDSNNKKMAIGDPVSTTITSKFGKREGNDIVSNDHRGLDIAGEIGKTSVIAAQNGTVIKVAEGETGSCVEGDTNCGGKFGNFVVIQHTDGNYTIYAHMDTNSIIVKEGDNVDQGQVIGYVGSTGSSTGGHLHFEVRIGGNDSNSAQDPLNFIDAENPRGSSSCGLSDDFTKMLHYFEGGCNADKNGNNYVVVDDGVGVPTAGYGVALKYNIDRFKNHGVNVVGMSFGAEIPIEIVDAVELEEVEKDEEELKKKLSAAGVTLDRPQLDCLIMVTYQFGNIGNFTDMYKQYGNTDILKNVVYSYGKKQWHYFKDNPSTGNGRAEATWLLFHEGKYTYNNCD